MADCPSCGDRPLAPTLLSPGLSARGCTQCRGALVDLVAYRAWADRQGREEANTRPVETIDDTGHALSCPQCKAVMIKMRLGTGTDNRLDFCTRCDAVWLDDGEWSQLDGLGLRHRLGNVFTEPWQRRVREDAQRERRDEVLRARFADDYDRIARFRAWLAEHPDRSAILAWLSDD